MRRVVRRARAAAPREHAQRKVGEEAVEVLLRRRGAASWSARSPTSWFHSMVLLARDGIDPLDAFAELARRHAASP